MEEGKEKVCALDLSPRIFGVFAKSHKWVLFLTLLNEVHGLIIESGRIVANLNISTDSSFVQK